LKKNYTGLLVLFFLCLTISSCGVKSKRLNFKNFPVNYKIAYFEELGVKNPPSVKDLFGRNASYADEFMGVPANVIIDSYSCTDNVFTVDILIRVKETKYDIMRCIFTIEADDTIGKSYIRYVKVESLLSDLYLESQSDGSEYLDNQTFELFLRYMYAIWK
jgi:hypothetical protein